MRGGLRTRDRRALVVGGALIGGMLIVARLLPAVRNAEEQFLLERERLSLSGAHSRQLARAALAMLDSAGDASGGNRGATGTPILRGPTAAEAAAQLLARVSGLAEFAGANVLSAAAAGDTAYREDFAEVATRLSLAMDDVALVRFVSAVEADPARLVILSMRAVRSGPTIDGPDSRALLVETLVAAIARREAAPASIKEAPRVATH